MSDVTLMSLPGIEGGCFCGAVRYRAAVAPTNSMVCHCNTCRRIAAAPAVAWVNFPKAQFAFTKGTPSEIRSSKEVRRTFCSQCGSPLTYEHASEPDIIDVTTCSLETPAAFPPTYHAWLNHNVAWVHFGDGLPTYPESRWDTGA